MLNTLLSSWGRVALLVLLLLGGRAGQASHLLGGEMTYRYLDARGSAARPFRYEITVSMYINADSVAGSPTLSNVPLGRSSIWVGLYYKGGARDGDSLGFVNLLPISKRLVTPRALAGCPPAGIPVRLTVYRTVVQLPLSLGGYYAYVSDGTRNTAILNIEDVPLFRSENENMTLYADLAPPLIPNASPTFSDTAVVLICAGDTTALLNSASDADGDRLTYNFGVPYSIPPVVPFNATAQVNSQYNTPVHFVPPPATVRFGTGYGLARPFGSQSGNLAQLNPSNGLSIYRALNVGRYVVAVDVNEYRNINGQDILIGRTRRDIQLVVRVCPAGATPALPPPRSYTVEEGQTLSFPIAATSNNAQVPLTLKVNSPLLDGAGGLNAAFDNNPGTVAAGQATGVVSIRGTGTAMASFTFTPACGSASAVPHDVLVTTIAQDCRRQADASVYRITVVKPAGPTRIVGDSALCDPAALRTYSAPGPLRPSYHWRVTGGSIVGAATGNTVQVRWAATASTRQLEVNGLLAAGCPTDTVSQSILVQPGGPTLAVSGTLSICPGDSTSLALAGAASYTVVGGGQLLNGTGPFTLKPMATTAYVITGRTAAGCTGTATATVVVQPAAALVLSGPLSICPGESTTLTVAGGAGRYTLSGGGQTLSSTGSFTLSPAATTTYTASGSSAAGCPAAPATATVVVRAAEACLPPDYSLFFPNIITPNGDRVNDLFEIRNVAHYPGSSLTILNRWGREVYHATDYQNTWGDGLSVGAGTYFYLFQLADGTVTKGWVEVVK